MKTNYYWLKFETDINKILQYIWDKHIIDLWLMIVYIENSTFYEWEWCWAADMCDITDLAHRILKKIERLKIIKRRSWKRFEIISI